MACIFSHHFWECSAWSKYNNTIHTIFHAGPLLHPSQRFENHSIFSPTLHAASVNKIEMNSVIIRLSGQGPYLAERGKKHIFPPSLVFGRFILVKLWLHPRYKAAGTRRTKKKQTKRAVFITNPHAIDLSETRTPNIQMYRWKLAHLHLFLHERREEWLLITRKFHICMMSRLTCRELYWWKPVLLSFTSTPRKIIFMRALLFG